MIYIHRVIKVVVKELVIKKAFNNHQKIIYFGIKHGRTRVFKF